MGIIDRAKKVEAETRARLLRGARHLEEKIQQRLQGEYVGEEPLELWRAISRDVESRIQPVPGGRIFPYNQIVTTVCAPSPERQAVLSAAFEPSRLHEDVCQLLRAAECAVPSNLSVALKFATQPGEDWTNPVLHIKYARQVKRSSVQATQAPVQPERRTATVRVLQGHASQPAYELKRDITFIGRGTSFSGRGVNHVNDIVFEDNDDPINRTVSRKHARIVYDPSTGDWTLYDESSARGTTLVRGGRTSRIAPGAHGRKLQPGDQILIGKAVLEFK